MNDAFHYTDMSSMLKRTLSDSVVETETETQLEWIESYECEFDALYQHVFSPVIWFVIRYFIRHTGRKHAQNPIYSVSQKKIPPRGPDIF